MLILQGRRLCSYLLCIMYLTPIVSGKMILLIPGQKLSRARFQLNTVWRIRYIAGNQACELDSPLMILGSAYGI